MTGTIQAADANEVMVRLRQQGYFPSSVAAAKGQTLRRRSARRLRARDIAVFARQFAIMLETGMPVVDSLDILSGQQPQPALKAALQDVRREVSGGRGFGESLRLHPRIFPDMFVNMVEVGEASGNLPEILNRMADFYEREAKLRGDIKQATTYPTVVLSFAVIAIGIVMFVILPTFADIFSDFGVELPLITRLVIGFRDFVIGHFLILLPLTAALGWLLVRYFRGAQGRLLLDGWLLRIPIVGTLIAKVVFARFARTLGLLYVSGISMVESLAHCGNIVGNTVVARDIAAAREGVQRGEGISGPLRAEAKAFPRMLTEMIAVGEETGRLDEVLTQVADFYDREVEQTVKSLTSVIEPVIMVVLGAVVFIIVLSVFGPMFDMVNVIQ